MYNIFKHGYDNKSLFYLFVAAYWAHILPIIDYYCQISLSIIKISY